MTQLVSDNFVRANSSNLGSNWAVISSDAAFTIASDLAVPTNAVSGNDSEEAYTAYSSGTFPNDQYAEVTIASIAGNAIGGGAGIGALVRGATGTYTRYRIVVSGSDWGVDKAVSGTFTTIATGSGTFAAADVIRLSVTGTTLTATKNGTTLWTGTDSSLSSGLPGITYSTSGVGGSSASVSLWAAGSPSSGGTTYTQVCSVSSSVAVGLIRHMGKTVSLSTATSLSLQRSIGKTFGVTTSASVSLTRRIAKTLAMATSVAVSASHGLAFGLTFAVASAVSVACSARNVLSETFAVSTAAGVGLVKRISKTLAVTSGVTTGLVRSIGKILPVTTAVAIGLSERLTLHRTFAATTAAGVSLAVSRVRKLVFSVSSAVLVALATTYIPAVVITTSGVRRVIRQLYNFLSRR